MARISKLRLLKKTEMVMKRRSLGQDSVRGTNEIIEEKGKGVHKINRRETFKGEESWPRFGKKKRWRGLVFRG